jgi:hypothetical protein
LRVEKSLGGDDLEPHVFSHLRDQVLAVEGEVNAAPFLERQVHVPVPKLVDVIDEVEEDEGKELAVGHHEQHLTAGSQRSQALTEHEVGVAEVLQRVTGVDEVELLVSKGKTPIGDMQQVRLAVRVDVEPHAVGILLLRKPAADVDAAYVAQFQLCQLAVGPIGAHACSRRLIVFTER